MGPGAGRALIPRKKILGAVLSKSVSSQNLTESGRVVPRKRRGPNVLRKDTKTRSSTAQGSEGLGMLEPPWGVVQGI